MIKSAIRVKVVGFTDIVEPSNDISESLEISKMINCDGAVVDYEADHCSGFTEFTYIVKNIIPIELIISIFKQYGEISLIWASSKCETVESPKEYVQMAKHHIMGNYSQECCGYYFYDGEQMFMGIGTEQKVIRELSVCSWCWLDGRKPKESDVFVLRQCKTREEFLREKPNGDYKTYFEEHFIYPGIDSVISDVANI